LRAAASCSVTRAPNPRPDCFWKAVIPLSLRSGTTKSPTFSRNMSGLNFVPVKSKLLLVLAFWCGTAVGWTQTNHIALEEFRQVHLPDVVLESVKYVAPDEQKKTPAGYVEVKGIIGDHIRFELLLPDAWNKRFVMGGGGGFVGTVQN